MIQKSALSIAALALSAAASNAASVSFNVAAEALKDSSGSLMMQTGVVLLVASTDNAVFEPVGAGVYDTGDFIGGGDDVILWRTDVTANATDGLLFDSTPPLVLDDADMGAGFIPNLTAGDPISLYWFPTVNNNGGMGEVTLGVGDQLGSYTDAVGIDGSIAWLMPASGTFELNFLTADAANFGPGTNPASAGDAAGLVIPEPSSLLSMMLGVILLFRRRR